MCRIVNLYKFYFYVNIIVIALLLITIYFYSLDFLWLVVMGSTLIIELITVNLSKTEKKMMKKRLTIKS